jgi:predicted small lipoprotein YifL
MSRSALVLCLLVAAVGLSLAGCGVGDGGSSLPPTTVHAPVQTETEDVGAEEDDQGEENNAGSKGKGRDKDKGKGKDVGHGSESD